MESLALRGRPDVIARLEGPPIPEPLEYLHGWFRELSTMREYGYAGPLPFSATLIESWARLTGVVPTPAEVLALARLSVIAVNPPPEED